MAFDVYLSTEEIDKKGGKALEDIGDSVKKVGGALTKLIEVQWTRNQADIFESVLSDVDDAFYRLQLDPNSQELYTQAKLGIENLEDFVYSQLNTRSYFI